MSQAVTGLIVRTIILPRGNPGEVSRPLPGWARDALNAARDLRCGAIECLIMDGREHAEVLADARGRVARAVEMAPAAVSADLAQTLDRLALLGAAVAYADLDDLGDAYDAEATTIEGLCRTVTAAPAGRA